jgi:hypothetical protein
VEKIKFFLERYGIHCFLLPIFFILHNYKQYYGLVSEDVAIKVFLKILIVIIAFSLLLKIIIKNSNRSLQLATLLSFIILFYGVIKDFFEFTLHTPFIARYSILFPLLLVVIIILIRKIIKKKNFRKTNLFQNLLLLIFIFIDGVGIIANHSSLIHQNLLTKNSYLKIDSLQRPPVRLNIYYVVLDCYPGTLFLKNYMQYDNSSFDESLKDKGFYVLKDSKSNYNRTAFSISSTLNFDYLKKIKNFSTVSPRDYEQTILTTKESIVPKIFRQYGYSFYNLSIFDIGDHPSIFKENFLTMPEENILLYNTLIERTKNDLIWNLLTGKYAVAFVQKIFKKRQYKLIKQQKAKKDFNSSIIDSLMKIPLQKNRSPKFVYAHLYLPHPPFFYDKNGKMNNLDSVLLRKSQRDKSLFLSYLEYTNKIILKVTERIIQTEKDNALIILQGDHGFTDFEGGPTDPALFFKNYSAFYFPDKNYSVLYDTMSNINTFPVIFNKYFETKIPLQKDTTVFLAQ